MSEKMMPESPQPAPPDEPKTEELSQEFDYKTTRLIVTRSKYFGSSELIVMEVHRSGIVDSSPLSVVWDIYKLHKRNTDIGEMSKEIEESVMDTYRGRIKEAMKKMEDHLEEFCKRIEEVERRKPRFGWSKKLLKPKHWEEFEDDY